MILIKRRRIDTQKNLRMMELNNMKMDKMWPKSEMMCSLFVSADFYLVFLACCLRVFWSTSGRSETSFVAFFVFFGDFGA